MGLAKQLKFVVGLFELFANQVRQFDHFNTRTRQDVCLLGLAGAITGGVLTASAVVSRNLMSVVTKPARQGQIAA